MINGRLGELVAEHSAPCVEIQRKHDQHRQDGDRQEQAAAASLDQEKLRGVGTAVAGDFSAGGVPDGEELGGEGGRSGHAAVVAAELDEEEDEDAEEGADGGDVEQVLDVAVPGGVIAAIAGGRRRRESLVHGGASEKD